MCFDGCNSDEANIGTGSEGNGGGGHGGNGSISFTYGDSNFSCSGNKNSCDDMSKNDNVESGNIDKSVASHRNDFEEFHPFHPSDQFKGGICGSLSPSNLVHQDTLH